MTSAADSYTKNQDCKNRTNPDHGRTVGAATVQSSLIAAHDGCKRGESLCGIEGCGRPATGEEQEG